MPSALSAPHFHSDEAAYAYVEKRIWPEGPVCPHCGGVERIGKMGGKSTRIGTYKCYQCRKPFTVKIGTIFEASHVPLNVWLQAMYLIAGSKKGISSNQLHRTLGVTLKTAWFMGHRIREAMRSGDLSPFGSDGGIVEADETFIGTEPHAKLYTKARECTIASRMQCDARGCQPFNSPISIMIFSPERTYTRCDARGCDEWRATFNRSGFFLNVELRGRAAFARMGDDLSFSEVMTLGHVVLVSHGRCQESDGPIVRPSPPRP